MRPRTHYRVAGGERPGVSACGRNGQHVTPVLAEVDCRVCRRSRTFQRHKAELEQRIDEQLRARPDYPHG